MNKRNRTSLNRQTLERLLLCYHYLNNNLHQFDTGTVSSVHIAEILNTDESQVRKDFTSIGIRGRPRVGFVVKEVVRAIRHALGFDEKNSAVVIGAGRLGGAISAYEGFVAQGLKIVALFDVNPEKIGLVIGGHIVQPLEQLEVIIKKHHVRLAVLTVPAHAAQMIADRLMKADIQAIWNFSPTHLNVPGNIIVKNERLIVGLAELSYHLKTLHEWRAHR